MKIAILPILILCLAVSSAAYSQTTFDFHSPLGKTEQCVILPQMPGAGYSAKDIEKEKELCALDFYDGQTAMCPKTWSTSAATILQKPDAGLTVSRHEATRCGDRSIKTIAKFKQTMNQAKTSGTYSISSLLYYHFSRFFDTSVKVPVAVYRTIDKDVHLERVSSKGRGTGMNAAAWNVMRQVLPNPSAYVPTSDLFTPDRTQIYGVLLKDSGERYGTEFNGVRSSWGDGQNYDFQKTAPFNALRSELPLKDAIITGEDQARRDAKMNVDLGPGRVNGLQMVVWMKELAEITLLDFIFSQQDRVGNIDYKWAFYWVDQAGKGQSEGVDSKLPRRRMNQIAVPEAIKAFNPILMQRTFIGDNDAGGRVAYTNFTKRTKMLENIRHYNSELYAHLMELDADLKAQGPIYQFVVENFKLDAGGIKQIVNNTRLAADIMRSSCTAGLLQFDLRPNPYMQGKETLEAVDCTTGAVR
jgi:hypothetical protein